MNEYSVTVDGNVACIWIQLCPEDAAPVPHLTLGLQTNEDAANLADFLTGLGVKDGL